MEDNTSHPRMTLKERLEPPEHSTASIVLNGAGNGFMLGGLPPLIYKVATEVGNVRPRWNYGKMAGFTAVAGTVLGAVYGLREADRTNEYRSTVATEILRLRRDVDAQKGWAAKLEARDSVKPEPVLSK